MNTRVRFILLAVVALIMCFVLAMPVAAVVAGVLHLIAPATFRFWMSFVYAVIGCGVFNVCAAWRSQKGYIKAYWESATVA